MPEAEQDDAAQMEPAEPADDAKEKAEPEVDVEVAGASQEVKATVDQQEPEE